MDFKYIEQLLERYWQCETSLEEEAQLRAFFKENDVPEHLLRYKDLFVYQQLQQEEQLSEDAGTNHVESENQWISDDGEDLDDTKVTFQKQGMDGETAQNTVDNNESDNTADVDKTDNALNSQQAEES